MPIPILMPALSPTMEEGTLAKWHVKVGDAVKSGQVIAEIETDKATMEVEAVDEGRVGEIVVPEGTQGVKVNAPIAVLLGEGEDASAVKAVAPKSAASGHSPQPSPKGEGVLKPSPSGEGGRALARPGEGQHGTAAEPSANGRIFASPLARRLAAERKLDLSRLEGSGPRGRIVKRDIEAGAAPMRARMPDARLPETRAPEAPPRRSRRRAARAFGARRRPGRRPP